MSVKSKLYKVFPLGLQFKFSRVEPLTFMVKTIVEKKYPWWRLFRARDKTIHAGYNMIIYRYNFHETIFVYVPYHS